MKSATKRSILYVFLLIVACSCNQETIIEPSPPTFEDWTLYQTTTGGLNAEVLSYFSLPANGLSYSSGQIREVSLATGQIAMGEDILSESTITGQAISLQWTDNNGSFSCTGKINGDTMSGDWVMHEPYSSSSGTWRAVKGLDDVENGSYIRYLVTGMTRLYFMAWTKNASSVYLTGDFIVGAVDLVKCGKTRLNMDIWNISSTTDCSSESYYEFASQSSPITVDVHIVTPLGEIVRTKSINYGSDVTGN